MTGLKIDFSFWEGLFRYSIHIMSVQPSPDEYGLGKWFRVNKKFLGIRTTEVLDSIERPYNQIIIKVKEKYNI